MNNHDLRNVKLLTERLHGYDAARAVGLFLLTLTFAWFVTGPWVSRNDTYSGLHTGVGYGTGIALLLVFIIMMFLFPKPQETKKQLEALIRIAKQQSAELELLRLTMNEALRQEPGIIKPMLISLITDWVFRMLSEGQGDLARSYLLSLPEEVQSLIRQRLDELGKERQGNYLDNLERAQQEGNTLSSGFYVHLAENTKEIERARALLPDTRR